MSTQTQQVLVQGQVPTKTKLDLKELQEKQLSGEKIEEATGNQDSSYTFPKYESSYIHVRLTKKVNDPIKKEYSEETTAKKYAPVQFDRMVKNNYFDAQTYDKVEVLHDPRSAAVIAQVEEKAAEGTKPWEPVPGLPSLQDAQLRYQQLYGTKAPAVSYEALVEFIIAKENSGGDEGGSSEEEEGENDAPTARKVIRSTVDAQERFKELFNQDPGDKSFTELKALIDAEEKRLEDVGNATN